MNGEPLPVVSVVVVAYNTRDLVLRCLRTVYERGGVPLEVILVDNASGDGTVEAVRDAFPQATVLANTENAGFPRACNQALRVARGEYVLYLNSDAFIGEGTLPRCVRELESDPGVGVVGCRLVLPDGRTQYEGGRNTYTLRHLAAELLYLHVLFPRSRLWGHYLMGWWDHADTRDVDAVSGAFLLARRTVIDAAGGLPELFPFAHEDVSFCLRARRLGWRIRYIGEVDTLHLTNQSVRSSGVSFHRDEGPIKVQLIREAQGDVAAALARVLFALRSLLRLPLALAGLLLPAGSAVKRRYPNVFALRLHALNLLWSLAPWLVPPRAPGIPTARR